MLFSPFFSIYFIRWHIRPNMVTLFMIIFGILGAILFTLPYGICKIIGFICFHLWYIMDCSDGEVARHTKTFSNYGREMDFMAHLICHPAMNLSLWITYIQIDQFSPLWVSFIFISFISLELVNRNLIAFDIYLHKDETNQLASITPPLYNYIIRQIVNYPNFILIFPLFTILNWFQILNSLWILIIWFIIFSFCVLRNIQKHLTRFYH